MTMLLKFINSYKVPLPVFSINPPQAAILKKCLENPHKTVYLCIRIYKNVKSMNRQAGRLLKKIDLGTNNLPLLDDRGPLSGWLVANNLYKDFCHHLHRAMEISGVPGVILIRTIWIHKILQFNGYRI